MKLLIVLALCAIGIATQQNWDEIRREDYRDTHYQTRREYRYLYNGQITTGMPDVSNQHGATRIQAEVSLTFPNNERTAVLRILRMRFATTNRELPEHRDLHQFEVFEHKEMDEEHKRLLELPLRFMYVDGLVTDIEFDREDKPWSENLKRAILNMLQVNIKKNVVRNDKNDERRYRNEKDERDEREEMHDDFFRTEEKTLEGDCETMYTFNKRENEEVEREREQRDERDMLKITKSINFEKCRERVDVRYNHRFLDDCEECNEENTEHERPTKTTTVFNYDITRNKDKFLIEKVEVKSQYVFTPMDKEDNPVVTFVFNRLELVNVRENIEDHREPQADRKEQLMYSLERMIKIERFYMNGDEELDVEHPFVDIKNKYELIEQAMLRMLQHMEDKELGIEHEAVHQLARIVDILRMCNEEEIRMVHDRLYENKDRFDEKKLEKVRDILVDALAIAGTKNTIEHLVEKIVNRKITIFKAVKALQNLVHVRVISEKHIDTVLNLCKTEVAERNPMLKQTCLLTVGGMINGLCRDNKDRLAVEHKEERRCPRELKEKYLKELMNIYRNAETRYEKTLALKTLANAGLDVMVFELEKIIYDRKEERVIRNLAIDALRHLHRVMPRKIHRILMPLFKDRLEHPEVRMTALAHIMYTKPNRAILDQIAHTLYNERNRQVQTFTLTMMKTFAESKLPCEKKLAEDLQQSLRLARVHTEKWTESKYMHLPFYDHHHRSGMNLDLATMFTTDSLLPREMMMNLDTLFFGQWRKHTVQMGFVQYNLEQILEKIIRNTEDKNLEDIVVRGRRATTYRPTDLLRNLFEKLKVNTRREETNVVFDVYFRKNGLDFALIPFDERTVPEMMKVLREGKIDLTRLEQLLGQGFRFNTHFATYFYETARRIPTTIGMPLIILGKLPTVAGLEGEIKVEFTPKKMDKFNGMMANIRMRPVVATTHITQMHLRNPVVFSGIKMIQAGKINFPIEMNMDVKVEDKMEVKYRFKIPQEKKQIMNLHTRAVTVTSQWPRDVKTYVEPKEKTIHMNQHERKIRNIDRTLNFWEKWMGIRMNFRGQYHEDLQVMMRRKLHELITGENTLEVTMEPGRNTPREVVVVFEFDVTKEDKMERPEFDRFYEERRDRKLFEIEYEDEVKDEREHEYREQRDRWEERNDRRMRNDREDREEDERRIRDDERFEDRRMNERRDEDREERRMRDREDRRDEEERRMRNREDRRDEEERRMRNREERRDEEERRMRNREERRDRNEEREEERRNKDRNERRYEDNEERRMRDREERRDYEREERRDNDQEERRMRDREERRDENRQERRDENRQERRDENRQERRDENREDRRMRERMERGDENRRDENRRENMRNDEMRNDERRTVRTEREVNEDDEWREWDRKNRQNKERYEVERREEFNRYVKEYKLERGHKLRVNMRIEAVGTNVERKADFDLEATCDDRIRYCRMRLNGKRTPMLEDENREWTIKLDVQTLYPEQVRTMKELNEKKHREFNAQIKCEWGTEKKYHFHMKMQGEQNEEQRRWMKDIERLNTVERYDELMMATQLNQYKMNIDYRVHHELREHVNRLFNMLKSWEMWNTRIVRLDNDERKIFVKMMIDPRTQQYLTLMIDTPDETVEIKDLRLPFRVAPLMLNMRRDDMPVRSLTHFVKKTLAERRAECRVSTRKVTTFDDNELMMPMTTCYSVLAKDCTSEQPKFAVMMKKVKKDTENKKMKIIDEDRVIEIERRDDDMIVKVDGRRVDEDERLREKRIEKTEDMVVVELDDVLVRFDGRTASIKMSALYKNGQCGICGHYDDEQEDELRKPDNMLTEDMEEYHRSYLNKDEECEIEEDVIRDRKNYRNMRDSLEDEDEFRDDRNDERENERRKPILRTKVIEYNHELCFSMKPVNECPEDTYMNENDMVEKKVSFACLKRSRDETVKLARRARDFVVNMDNYKPSFVDNVRIPQTCIVF